MFFVLSYDAAQNVNEAITEAAQVSVPPDAGAAVAATGVDAEKTAPGNHALF
jgi:hypothetical protein